MAASALGLTERTVCGVRYLTAPHLGCPHGFSTRVGGVTTPPGRASLDLSLPTDETRAEIMENLTRFSRAVGFSPRSLVSLRQVHGCEVRTVGEREAGTAYFSDSDDGCDGYLTCARGVTLGVRTADCVPILLSAVDEYNRPYMVAALHAGWRGTVAGIARAGVARMLSLGAKPKHLRAAIGCAIHACCFVVDGEVRQAFRDAFGETVCRDREARDPQNPEKWHIDLIAHNRWQLESSGVPSDAVAVGDRCTCCTPSRFYSHRRDGSARGSMLSVICLP